MRALLRSMSKVRVLALVAAPLVINYYSRGGGISTEPLPVQNTSEIIALSHSLFFKEVLGNRSKFFFLVVYKETADGGPGEGEAVRVSKELAKLASDNSTAIPIYVISRPSLVEVKKQVDRVKNVELTQESEAKDVEIYFKTTYSDDYLYINCRKGRFFEPSHQAKLKQKIARIMNLYQVVQTPQELLDLVAENYYKLDAPILLKSFHVKTKQDEQALEYFKEGCFSLIERKLLSLDSKFILVKNQSKDLIRQLGLESSILMLQNDILQKYRDADTFDGRLVTRLQEAQNVEFIKEASLRFEASKNEDFFDSMADFVLPRIIYLRSSKRSEVARLLRKIQLCRDRQTMVLSLQLRESADEENQARIINFFKLHSEFASSNLIFMISNAHRVEDILPHLNYNHGNYCLFNLFNQIKPEPIKGYPAFKHSSMPYQKHFLIDPVNYIEDLDFMRSSIKSIQAQSLEERLAITDYIQYNQDTLPRINGLLLHALQRMKQPYYLHLKSRGMLGNSITQVLQRRRVSGIYELSSENQVADIDFSGSNYLIEWTGTAMIQHLIESSQQLDLILP